jgi:hypothetical protein
MADDQVPGEFHWAMSDPDADGNIWLKWTGEDGSHDDVMLGPTEQVMTCMADWLGRMDFGA